MIYLQEQSSGMVYRPMYFPNAGVLIEPDSLVISYDQVKYVSLIYDIQSPEVLTTHNCNNLDNLTESINKELNNKFDHLKTLIPMNSKNFMNEFCLGHMGLCLETTGTTSTNNTPREKRSLIALAAVSGLIGLGNSAYTWYTGNKMEKHIDNLRSRISKLTQDEYLLRHKMTEVIALEDDIIKKSAQSFINLKNFIERSACGKEEYILKNLMGIMMLEISRDFSAITNMINGIPDPQIMSADVVTKIIEENSEFTDSIYQDDRGLLLTVTKTNLILADDHRSHLVFLLEVPIIKKHMYSPLFRVYNGGWETEGVFHKLDLPVNFYLYGSDEDGTFKAVSSIHESCYYRSHMYICDNSKHFLKNEMICMNALLKNISYGNCDVKITKRVEDTTVVKTKSGVFATGRPVVTKIDSVGESYHMITDSKLSSNYTQYYPFGSFSKIIIESVIIMSNKERIPVIYVNHSYQRVLDFSLDDAHSYLVSNPWTSIKTIKQLVENDDLLTMTPLYHKSNHYTLYLVLLSLLLIILTAAAILVIYKKMQNTKDKLKRNQVVLSALLQSRKR